MCPQDCAKWAVHQPPLLWGEQGVNIASLLVKMAHQKLDQTTPFCYRLWTDYDRPYPCLQEKELLQNLFPTNVSSFHRVWAFTGHCEPENQTCVASEKDQIWPHSHLWVNRTIRCIQSVKADPENERVYIKNDTFIFSNLEGLPGDLEKVI